MSAGGATQEVLQREGRWASDAYKAYVRSYGKDADWVASVMARDGLGNGIQPGQGTEWVKVGSLPELDVQSRRKRFLLLSHCYVCLVASKDNKLRLWRACPKVELGG